LVATRSLFGNFFLGDGYVISIFLLGSSLCGTYFLETAVGLFFIFKIGDSSFNMSFVDYFY
jgi:hypothetical protein